MTVNGAAQPARDPGSPPKPKRTPANRGITGANPTPLDSLFILFASVFLLLLLLWIASQLAGRDLFTQLPPWVNDVVKGIWSKVIVGTGTAGTLALRKWLYKSTPSPNYLLWIPGFTIFFMLALFLVKLLVPALPEPTTHFRLPIRFSAKPLQADLTTSDTKEISIRRTLPKKDLRPIYIPLDQPEEKGLYSYEVDVPGSGEFQAEIMHRAVQSRLVASAVHDYEYLLCIKNNPKKPFPANLSTESPNPLIQLSCSKDPNSDDTKCLSVGGGPGYLMSCDDVAQNAGPLPAVYAAEPSEQARKPGWVVPSLETLDKMTDRERVGYTRFYVSFTPTGQAAAADRYYYILRVNDKPIYVDGFLPEKIIYPLQKGATNWISFALENLNFTGQNEGYEKLHLDIVFLRGEDEIYRQEFGRDYVALRSAPEVTKDSPVGTFRWTGEYVAPKNENKYEVMLASSNCSDPSDRGCVDRAMNAKTKFDQAGLKFNGQPIVMVVRPPLRIPPSYGLTLGVVQPTSQVQFTFNAEEAAQVCHWAMQQIGTSAAGNLIQPNLRRYEVATRGYSPCN